MRIRNRVTRVMFSCAAATSAAVLAGAGSAHAADDATISITSTSPDGAYTAVTSHSSFLDLNSGVTLTCTGGGGQNYGSQGTGALPDQSGQPLPSTQATGISSLLFNTAGGCTSLLGSVTSIATDTPYEIVIQNYPGVKSDGVTPANGDGYIHIKNVNVSMPACSFTVSGDAPIYYDNATHSLNVTPDVAPEYGTGAGGDVTLPDGPLTINNVRGCLGEVNNGDIGAYYATADAEDPFGNDTPYVLDSGLQITSP
ncbi:hypothetical protein [Actinoplanes sp. NPDC089786]|uniref:hypothetical protein n=1 Tax=Actinoplanes sp. NPDC089786 TaxID=3155185 RepID=UPI00342F130A